MPLTRRGKWLAAGAAGFAAIAVLGLISPNPASEIQPAPAPTYTVDVSPIGKHVSFGALAFSPPGTLTIDCMGGKVSGFSVALDEPPKSPPPLRGVFADIRLGNEAKQRIEVAYLFKGYWATRDEEQGNAKAIAQRFARGDRLDFILPKPNGSGLKISWQYPSGINIPDCRA